VDDVRATSSPLAALMTVLNFIPHYTLQQKCTSHFQILYSICFSHVNSVQRDQWSTSVRSAQNYVDS